MNGHENLSAGQETPMESKSSSYWFYKQEASLRPNYTSDQWLQRSRLFIVIVTSKLGSVGASSCDFQARKFCGLKLNLMEGTNGRSS